MFKKKKVLECYPTHIAFIMDGNRRWATRRGLNKMVGHRQGGLAFKNLVDILDDYPEIKYASFLHFRQKIGIENKKRLIISLK